MPNTVPAAAEGLPEIQPTVTNAAILREWSKLSTGDKRAVLDQLRDGMTVTRRKALTLTSVGLIAALTSVAETVKAPAAADTPVMTLFREWEATWSRAGSEAETLPQSEINALMDACNDLEARMLALPSLSAVDFAAKYIAHSGYGGFIIEDDSPFSAEAAALVKGA